MNKSKRIIFPVILLMLVSIDAIAQSTFPPDKDQLLKGEAGVRILTAERNGFPSPQRVIALKDQLGLTKDQVKKIDEMLTNLPISAAVKGQDIIEAEEDLNRLFESGNINEKTLRTKLERIGKLRADLYFIHLQVYIRTKKVLTDKQLDRFKEIQPGETK
jgi:Spy/CpxP family protein refolding chaperone